MLMPWYAGFFVCKLKKLSNAEKVDTQGDEGEEDGDEKPSSSDEEPAHGDSPGSDEDDESGQAVQAAPAREEQPSKATFANGAGKAEQDKHLRARVRGKKKPAKKAAGKIHSLSVRQASRVG